MSKVVSLMERRLKKATPCRNHPHCQAYWYKGEAWHPIPKFMNEIFAVCTDCATAIRAKGRRLRRKLEK